ncbi:MAG: hypothetical protein KDA32_05465 [Phycisphaerales bacterium]|nr:hypothetical protein [Phycisphaerales bacterium]
MLLTVNRNPSSRDLRQFALGMLIGFGVLALLAWWRAHPIMAVTFASIGAALAILSQIPGVNRHVYVAWMTGAHGLGFAMTNVLLTIMFVTLLVPFALLRLRDPLRKKRGAASYWEPPERHEPSIERMSRQF